MRLDGLIINVYGKEIKVIEKDLNEAYGYYDPKKNIIELKKDMKQDQKVSTLVHEIGHALLDRLGISGDLGDIVEHAIVYGFEQVLSENFEIKLKSKRERKKK